MKKVSTIGLDLAKNVFQAHGADASGAVIFRKKLRRAHVLEFFATQPACIVAMAELAEGPISGVGRSVITGIACG